MKVYKILLLSIPFLFLSTSITLMNRNRIFKLSKQSDLNKILADTKEGNANDSGMMKVADTKDGNTNNSVMMKVADTKEGNAYDTHG